MSALDPTSDSELAKTFSRGDPLPSWAVPLADIPPTSRKEATVARLLETQAWAGAEPALLINRAFQVNEAKSLGFIGQYAVDYFPAYQKLHVHRIAIIRGTEVLDRTMTAGLRLLMNEPDDGNEMWSGGASMKLLLDDIRVGDTLWITYSIEGNNPVFEGHWGDQFGVDSGGAAERRRLIVLHPRTRPIHWRQLGDYPTGKLTPQIEQTKDIEQIRFDLRNLEPVANEQGIPNDYMPVRMLQFSDFADWHGVAQWASGLFPKVGASPKLDELAVQFSKEPGQLAQAGAALHWVQREVRYFSVDFGENSHRPHAPDDVLEHRYGDCKDKSYLLVSLLQRLGIEARPVLVQAKAAALPAHDAPAHDVFNHVIVQLAIAGKTYYVDPTRIDQAEPIDKLPAAFPGGAVLVVDAGTTALTTLPASSFDGPLYEHTDRFAVPSYEGDATLETRDIYRDRYADWARSRFPGSSDEDLKKSMLADYEKLYPGITIAATPQLEDDAVNNVYTVTTHYLLPAPIELKEDKRHHSLEIETQILEDTLTTPSNLARHFPYALEKGKFHGRYRLEIVWPEEQREGNLPHATHIESPYFDALEEYSHLGNVLSYMIDYRVKKAEVGADEVAKLHAEAKRLNNTAGSSFHTSTYGDVKPSEMPLSLRLLEEERFIGDMKGDGNRLLAIYKNTNILSYLCDTLVNGYAMADQMWPALIEQRDKASQSLEQHLDKAGIGACLGRVEAAQGKYKEAISHFEADKEFKPENEHYAELAWVRYYAGDAAGAQVDIKHFLDARAAREDDGLTSYNLLSMGALLQRLGKPLPAATQERLARLPDGPWPAPLLAWQAGRLDGAALDKIVDAYPIDVRELAQTDKWLFFGERALAEHDIKAARRWFSKSRIDGVRSRSSYQQAMEELDLLLPDYDLVHPAMLAQDKGDTERAVKLWREAADRGSAPGQFMLARAYYDGKGVEKNDIEARRWFELAAAQDDSDAMLRLGYMVHNGRGFEPDHQAELAWYAKAAELANADALDELSDAYRLGDIVEADDGKAYEYSRQAAQLEDAGAQAQLSYFYEMATGVPRSDRLSNFWAQRSASRNDVYGQYRLGVCYEEGLGVKKDTVEAMNHYGIAAQRGSRSAQYAVGRLYATLPELHDYKKAAEWYAKAAAQGNHEAQTALAGYYMEGRGVPVDIQQAKKLLDDAHDENQWADLMLNELAAGQHDSPNACGRAMEAFNGGMYQEAIVPLTACLAYQKSPKLQAQLYEWRATSNDSTKHYKNAVADQTQFIALQPPSDQWPLLMLARYQRDAKQYDASLATMDKVMAQFKNNGQTPGMPYGYHRSLTLQQMGRHQEAIDTLTEALPRQPEYAWAYYYRSISYEALGDTVHAKADMLQAYHLLSSHQEGRTWDTLGRFKQYGYSLAEEEP